MNNEQWTRDFDALIAERAEGLRVAEIVDDDYYVTHDGKPWKRALYRVYSFRHHYGDMWCRKWMVVDRRTLDFCIKGSWADAIDHVRREYARGGAR